MIKNNVLRTEYSNADLPLSASRSLANHWMANEEEALTPVAHDENQLLDAPRIAHGNADLAPLFEYSNYSLQGMTLFDN